MEEKRKKAEENLLRGQTTTHAPVTPVVGALPYFAALTVIYGVLVALSLHTIWRVPPPRAANGDLSLFSEGRAMRHVQALTDVGVRLVGYPETDVASDYLVRQGELLAAEAKASRPDLLVQVQRELVSGAVETEFLNTGYTNLYNNVTNVILVVSPRTGLHEKSVLVNAHFDSTLNTAGASDDASCVGIILELARTLIANPKIQLAAPVIFLMNGAEEAFCPAAHGFMQQSPWARDAGVFINLESTGTQGPDFLFQQTGQWPMQAFATVAPYPRGSVIAQDFFQLGLVPADTDYRMFSASLQGSLPGIDTAFLLGAGMYHTDRDTIENLRPGTLQAMGENALATAVELGKELARRRAKNVTSLDKENVFFFDVLGLFMVMYPFRWARLIHHLPLLFTLTTPLLQKAAFPGRSVISIYGSIGLESLAAVFSILATLGTCIFVAILRVTMLGNPMAWYGHPVWPFAMLVPAGVAGALLPYLGRSQQDARIRALGTMVALGGACSLLTQLELGASAVGAIWTLAGLVTLYDLERKPGKLLQTATLNCVFPALIFLPNGIALSTYVLEKTSLMGAQGGQFNAVVADAVAGGVVGITIVSVTGFVIPWIVHACGRGLRRVVLILLTISCLFAVQASLGLTPYTTLAPKKVFLQHHHHHQAGPATAAEGAVMRSVFAVGAVDSVGVAGLLAPKDPHLWEAKPLGWEWQTLFPFNEDYVSSMLMTAPGPPPTTGLPSVELIGREDLGKGRQRLTLQPHLPGPGFFGSMNITGRVLEWSYPRTETPSQNTGLEHSRFVRFVGTGPEEHWRFWVDLPQDEGLTLRLAAAHTRENRHIKEFVKDWPAWTFTAGVTTFASEWHF